MEIFMHLTKEIFMDDPIFGPILTRISKNSIPLFHTSLFKSLKYFAKYT